MTALVAIRMTTLEGQWRTATAVTDEIIKSTDEISSRKERIDFSTSELGRARLKWPFLRTLCIGFPSQGTWFEDVDPSQRNSRGYQSPTGSVLYCMDLLNYPTQVDCS